MTIPLYVASILPEAGAWVPIAIYCARVVDVSMGTVRLIFITRGHRTIAMALSFIEIVIWVLAISAVFSHLGNWINIVAYAGGYATGVAVGMWIEGKLAIGWQIVMFMSRVGDSAVAARLRDAGWLVTMLDGNGRSGPVSVCLAVASRKQVPLIIRAAREADPDVVVTVEDVVTRMGGIVPPPHPDGGIPRQVLKKLEATIRLSSAAESNDLKAGTAGGRGAQYENAMPADARASVQPAGSQQ